MKHIGIALLNGLLIVVTGVIHRVALRFFNLPYDNVFVFWGLFIGIMFILTLIISLIFSSPSTEK